MYPEAHAICLRSQLGVRTCFRGFVVHPFELRLELSFLLCRVLLRRAEQLIRDIHRHAGTRPIVLLRSKSRFFRSLQSVGLLILQKGTSLSLAKSVSSHPSILSNNRVLLRDDLGFLLLLPGRSQTPLTTVVGVIPPLWLFLGLPVTGRTLSDHVGFCHVWVLPVEVALTDANLLISLTLHVWLI